MKFEIEKVILPEGEFEVEVQKFEEKDRKIFNNIYENWRTLCEDLGKIRSRIVNIPEGLSEGAFCLEMDCWRLTANISKANSSFDCYSPKKNERIQVKSASKIPDLTSFGPKSEWDKIYFMDFYVNGFWDGKFDIYLIENEDIYNHKVNANQTLRDQQKEGRRPRFNIYKDIISIKDLKPIKRGNIKV
ncbi:Bsp6I family type II restriction endonuclease [Methanobrevibacter curvatus]|uniref:Bsp6I restriction endonuclease n=1 Tax=Methanobrevibacter curvatus TaxID=49547 RepID=A0A162FCU6_9EURY|nr:Bsp6I family type II restriction endonuclease [Methanobrevibacter curvatus]KZX11135.1 Bsp6I restriction endonuclease [Methanobrevibacter curvatus]